MEKYKVLARKIVEEIIQPKFIGARWRDDVMLEIIFRYDMSFEIFTQDYELKVNLSAELDNALKGCSVNEMRIIVDEMANLMQKPKYACKKVNVINYKAEYTSDTMNNNEDFCIFIYLP